MAFVRFELDIAIPEDVYDAIDESTKYDIRHRIKQLVSYSAKINAGKPNEENTTRAVWHICHHDTGEPCEPEQEIL